MRSKLLAILAAIMLFSSAPLAYAEPSQPPKTAAATSGIDLAPGQSVKKVFYVANPEKSGIDAITRIEITGYNQINGGEFALAGLSGTNTCGGTITASNIYGNIFKWTSSRTFQYNERVSVTITSRTDTHQEWQGWTFDHHGLKETYNSATWEMHVESVGNFRHVIYGNKAGFNYMRLRSNGQCYISGYVVDYWPWG